MNIKQYKIVCTNCKSQRQIKIVNLPQGESIDWMESQETMFHPINSGRKRLDGNWGFACSCGNNDILTNQEIRQIKNLQNPEVEDIQKVIQNLIPEKPKFKMVGG